MLIEFNSSVRKKSACFLYSAGVELPCEEDQIEMFFKIFPSVPYVSSEVPSVGSFPWQVRQIQLKTIFGHLSVYIIHGDCAFKWAAREMNDSRFRSFEPKRTSVMLWYEMGLKWLNVGELTFLLRCLRAEKDPRRSTPVDNALNRAIVSLKRK